MTVLRSIDPNHTPALLKERGAFFASDDITRFISRWSIRGADDLVMEPSGGDAAFLVSAMARLRELAAEPDTQPIVDGVEIHAHSVRVESQRVREVGGTAHLRHSDFFAIEPEPVYDTVIGKPPYIRYQDFSDECRLRAWEATLRGGVSLKGLASSWAAFTIH
ncbi:adenine-specific DNA methylase [Variovorax paradoxus]|uniref:hypothetical protein n=1 Tax=Variovorax paradoxus TaxID=34073 RepID=UPI002781CA32|nr:hypothetical protein [Variovorax paradoxus]MDQ0027879.1 adenine-specific DNA methylase [Variovorax paradoxus]